MNIYLHELRMLRGSLFSWVVGLSLLSLVFISLWPTFSGDIETSKKMLEQFPPTVRAAFGISLSIFSTFLGFYAYTFTYLTIAGAMQGMNLGIGVLNREPKAKTTDFLFTKPVTRTRIIIAKSAAALTVLVTTNILYTLITLGFTQLFSAGSFDVGHYIMLNVAYFCVQLWFFAAGVCASQILRRIRSVAAVSLTCVFGFFLVGLLQSLTNDEKLRYMSPFRYFDYLAYVSSGEHNLHYWAVGAVIMIVAMSVSYILYTRRDVEAV